MTSTREREDEPHEFCGGASWDDRVAPDPQACMYCGERDEHENHKNDDGTAFRDTDTVFDRMDARGHIRPRCR